MKPSLAARHDALLKRCRRDHFSYRPRPCRPAKPAGSANDTTS
jgi:hypothetical protein